MDIKTHEILLNIVRVGIGTSKDAKIPYDVDWAALKALADVQGLTAVVLDGLNEERSKKENVSDERFPSQQFTLQWIGEVMQNYEIRYQQYKKAIGSLAGWYNQHGFRMMVLKGYACSLDWPKPNHRPCGDIDIWQFGQQEAADKELLLCFKFQYPNFKIDSSHHHHTVFEWKGFSVENHYDFVNIHAHRSSRELEVIFKEFGQDDSRYVEVTGEKVYLPSPNLHALFLIKHMVSHFAAAEISLRQVLDWAFFVEKHGKEIDWGWLQGVLDKYHMRDFYNSINFICVDDLGFSSEMFPFIQFVPSLKEKVLNDILEPEFTTAEPNEFFRRMAYKYRRWKGNAWKQKMCYNESRWQSFCSGVWGHMLKPKTILR